MSEVSHNEQAWARRARAFLKAEMKKAEVTYAQLAERLTMHHGMKETEASITSKLGRGTFAATFFLAALTEIGCQVIRLEEV